MHSLCALVSAVLLVGSAYPAEQTQGAIPAILSSDQVTTIARSTFRAKNADASHFHAHLPKYQPDKQRWLVFYDQLGPAFAADADMVVVVDDRSKASCVVQAWLLDTATCT